MLPARSFLHPPLGYIALYGSEATGLAKVTFLPEPVPDLADDPFLHHVEARLKAYLAGHPDQFSDIPLRVVGTSFQQRVWRTLQSIPHGETRSYAWVAQQVGLPTGYRAVGNANGKNPLPIIVPCHRVVQHNGALGGYTGGTHIKRFLLDLENALSIPSQPVIPALLASV